MFVTSVDKGGRWLGFPVVEQSRSITGDHFVVNPIGKFLHIRGRGLLRSVKALSIVKVMGHVARGDDQPPLVCERFQRLAHPVRLRWA